VGPLGTNAYIFGSSETREVVIIDPGGNEDEIIKEIKELEAKPIAVLLTHGHFDHTMKVGKILRFYKIPLMFSKKEYDSGIFSNKTANRWLNEGDIIQVGDISLHVLETPGHSPGSLCFYTKDITEFNNEKVDGILFSGDLLFKQSIGRSDFEGGDQNLLFKSIRTKIMNNDNLSDNFIVLPGHMGFTTIRFERKNNMFRNYFV
jgi:glyoxylase-like metal-dependent hydrolase (beta-lactamase superfamily II)